MNVRKSKAAVLRGKTDRERKSSDDEHAAVEEFEREGMGVAAKE